MRVLTTARLFPPRALGAVLTASRPRPLLTMHASAHHGAPFPSLATGCRPDGLTPPPAARHSLARSHLAVAPRAARAALAARAPRAQGTQQAVRWDVLSETQPGQAVRRGSLLEGSLTASDVITVSHAGNLFGRGTHALKASAVVQASAASTFAAVTDLAQRVRWDSLLDSGTVHRTLDEKNALVYFKMKPIVSGGRPHDYTLLQSWRVQDDGSYVIASRSVVTPELPPVRGCTRGAVLPSGFQLEPLDTARTRVTYIVQMEQQRGITGAFGAAILRRAAELMRRRFVLLEELLRTAATDPAGAATAGSRSRGSWLPRLSVRRPDAVPPVPPAPAAAPAQEVALQPTSTSPTSQVQPGNV